MGKREELKELQEKLERQERTTGMGGAVSRTPKEALLEAPEAQAKNPDKHLRWVNTKDPQKAESRLNEGYVKLSEEEGGRNIGSELALMAIPRQKYEEKVQAQQERTQQMLVAHRADVERAAEAVARELRDRHGMRVRDRDLYQNDER